MPETAPKKRGRKPTGTAKTGAERQRRYIERLKAGANVVTDANRIETLERELSEVRRELADARLLNEKMGKLNRELLEEVEELKAPKPKRRTAKR